MHVLRFFFRSALALLRSRSTPPVSFTSVNLWWLSPSPSPSPSWPRLWCVYVMVVVVVGFGRVGGMDSTEEGSSEATRR